MAKITEKVNLNKCIICGSDLEAGKLGSVCNQCGDKMAFPDKKGIMRKRNKAKA